MLLAVMAACLWLPLASSTLYAQDSTASAPAKQKPKTKLTRAQILKMKVEDLLDLSLEEVTELLEIAGVSSLDELINLIVTTASKSEEKLQDAPGIITVVTQQEIIAFGATSLWEVLDRVVSLYLVGTAVLPQNMLSVRGAAQENFNTQVLYLLDGRPFRESVASGYISPMILGFPLSNIERVEVIRGPGSVLYGTCAYTGVVNIITKTDEVERFEASARYGSYNTFIGEITGGGKIGDLKISGGSYIYNSSGWPFTARGESDAVKNPDGTDRILRDPKTVPYFSRNFGANLKANYKGFTLTAYYGSVLQADMNANPTWASTIGTVNAPIERANEINRLIVDLGYATQVTSIWNTSINVTYNNLLYRFFRPVDTFKEDEIRRYTNDVVIEWTNYLKPIDKLNILVGALTNTQTGYALDLRLRPDGRTPWDIREKNPDPFYTISNYNQTWFTGYLQVDYRFLNDRLKLIAGGQLNKVTNIPLDFVPRLGAVANITDELRFKVLYGQAFRSAAAFERQTFSLPNAVGNPNLTPERIRTFEAQLSYTTPDFDVALTYFNSYQTDLIRRTVPGDPLSPIYTINGVTVSVPTFINSDQLYSQGFELEGKWIITNSLNLFGSVSYQTSTDSDPKIFGDSYGMPTLMAKLGLMYTSKIINAGIFNSFFSTGGDITAYNAQGQAITRRANPDVQAFSNLTLNVTLDVGKTFGWAGLEGWGLNIYGNNLLDAQIYYPEYVRRNINSLPGRQGRSLYGGIKVSL
jgi:outer membrane receptor protein involved in Fe transport